jgi:acyl-CoA thioester hydrolase
MVQRGRDPPVTSIFERRRDVVRCRRYVGVPSLTVYPVLVRGSRHECRHATGNAVFRRGKYMTQPIETYRGVVYPWHCDHMGHMNVMWYTGKFDEATWALFAAIGLTPSYLREQNRGMAAVQQNTTYRQELMAGDLVLIRSWVLEVREKVLRFMHEMVKADTGEVAATSELTGVHFDRAARRSSALPAAVAERAAALVCEAPA